MTRGRKPVPSALKKLAGNPGKRPLNNLEPKLVAPDAVPEPPDFLDEEAKAEWRRLAGELLAANVLVKVDTAALAAYCSWWSQFVEASEQIKKLEGQLTQAGKSGYEGPTAWLSIKKQASEQMHKYMTEFGLTPSSRSRLKVAAVEKKDPFDDFLGNPVIGKIG